MRAIADRSDFRFKSVPRLPVKREQLASARQWVTSLASPHNLDSAFRLISSCVSTIGHRGRVKESATLELGNCPGGSFPVPARDAECLFDTWTGSSPLSSAHLVSDTRYGELDGLELLLESARSPSGEPHHGADLGLLNPLQLSADVMTVHRLVPLLVHGKSVRLKLSVLCGATHRMSLCETC